MGPPPSPESNMFLQSPKFSLTSPYLLLVSFLFFTSPLLASPEPSTIYDHLRLNGLPIGLLPKNITKFSVDSSTGHFQVFIDHPCNAKFENEVHYDFNVSGRISLGQIAELAGISSQELFLWFPVKGIRVDLPPSGVIHFDVGVVKKQFSLSLFECPPECTATDPVDPSYPSGEAPVDEDGNLSKTEAHDLELEDSERSELQATS